MPKFIGPFTIMKEIRQVNYDVKFTFELDKVHRAFHVSFSRHLDFTSGQLPPPRAPYTWRREPEHIIEKMKIDVRSKRHYLVKWSGLGFEYKAWVSLHKYCSAPSKGITSLSRPIGKKRSLSQSEQYSLNQQGFGRVTQMCSFCAFMVITSAILASTKIGI